MNATPTPPGSGGLGKAVGSMAKKGAAGAAKQKMGIGGVNPASSKSSSSFATTPSGKGSSGVRNTAAATAGTTAGGLAAQAWTIAAFINWLKGMAFMLAALAMNALSALVAMVMMAVAKVVGGFMAFGAAAASFVGGAITATTAAVTSAAVVGTMVIGGGIAALGGGEEESAQREGSLMANGQCAADTETQLASFKSEGGEAGAASVEAEANAEIVYSIFAGWGMPDENIAGILGNWDAESRIDPTSVEGIFDEPHSIGPKKKKAEAENFTGFGYGGYSVAHRGIGLGQWTNDRNQTLVNYAKRNDVPWHSLETQLSFMVSADEGSDAEVVKDMIKNPVGSPGEAAVHFHHNWERSADTSMELRKKEANKWMGKFSGWSADKALADSLLKQAETTVSSANEARTASMVADCRSANASSVGLTEGGLTDEDAEELMALYRKEGSDFLKGRYGAGGPAGCGDDKADNCVSFSTYFVNKYTSFQQYAPGNGIDTAGSMADLMGKKTTNTPKPYSVASGPGTSSAGHTFVVLAIKGDTAVIGEANYCTGVMGTRNMSMSELTSGAWEFVDVSDIMLPEDEVHTA